MSDDGSFDTFTETTSTGWLSRLGQSLIGVLIGFVGILVAIAALYWNEGRAVDAASALSEGAGMVISAPAAPIEPSRDGKLVHVMGMAVALAPARDPVLGVTAPNLLRLRRVVEMYQWKEYQQTETNTELGGSETKRTTYDYRRIWTERPIASSSFRVPAGHGNPPMSMQSTTVAAPGGKLGDFRIAPPLLEKLDEFQPLVPEDTSALTARGYLPVDTGFYRGNDPATPRVGDIRLHFEAVSGQPITIVSGQFNNTLTPFNTSNGYEIALISPGSKPAAAMFKEAHDEEALLTWILRAVGFVGMLISLLLLFQPLSVLVSVLPFLETLVGAGAFLVAFVLAIPLTAITIAVAWFAHRPLLAGGLIIAGIALSYGASRLFPGRKAEGARPGRRTTGTRRGAARGNPTPD